MALAIVDAVVLSSSLLGFHHLLHAPSALGIRIVITILCYLVFLFAFDFYSPRQFDPEKNLYATFLVILFSTTLSVLFSYLLLFHPIGRKILLLHAVLAFGYVFLRGKFLSAANTHMQHRFILIGFRPEELKPETRERLSRHGDLVCAPDPGTISPVPGTPTDVYLVGKLTDLEPHAIHDLLLEKLRGRPVFTMAAFYEHFFRQVPADLVDIHFFFNASGFDRAMRRFPTTIKRMLDLVLAGTLFCLGAPIMLVTALAIRLESSGPALFRQQRTGLHGVPFTILKFRSMRQDAEQSGSPRWAAEDDPRITRVGRWIRKLRIDELPQLINVIRGEMSFVGPRPERPEFDEQLAEQLPFYMFRYLVKPGITGWAQVNYGYGASVEDALEKLRYDLYYVKHTSFLLDLEIFLKTASTVFMARGR